jgi:carbamoyl-phosphate synthase small subunit
MDGLELSSQVSTIEPFIEGDDNATFKVAVLDLGIKTSILKNLTSRDIQCKIFPAKASFEEMSAWKPDGYFISNGPGDPAAMLYAIETVRDIVEAEVPLFGICLGHQMLAQANDISTYKLHNGHRGLNHPVKNIITGRGEITSQNHGFGISEEDVKKSKRVEVTHVNLNDKSVEGIRLKNGRAFSVQYHPESSPGPHDSRYLFNDFVQMLKNK